MQDDEMGAMEKDWARQKARVANNEALNALTDQVERLEAALREIADGGHGHKICSQIARAALARK